MEYKSLSKKNRIFRILTAFVLLIVFVCRSLFASNVYIINGDEDIVIDKNKKGIAIIGDNYAKDFEKNIGYNSFTYYLYDDSDNIYSVENVTKTFMALENKDYNFVLFTLGSFSTVRDYDENAFYTYMKNYMDIAKREKKFVFLHTYMSFVGSNSERNKSSSVVLDSVLRKLAEAYDNVYYIDMSNFSTGGYLLADGKNYNALFYQTLCAKLMYIRDNINYVQYNIMSDWMLAANYNIIAVAGDSYAGTFARYEKDKKYNIQEFAKSGRTIGQNKDLINQSIDSTAKFVLISTSVNDYEKQSTLNSFEYNLRSFINHALLNYKIVFLHTYMKYSAAASREVKIKDYDDIIKKLAAEYDNVIYIDMHDYEKEEYQMPDKRHYDKEFNDALYDRIDKWIEAFKQK